MIAILNFIEFILQNVLLLIEIIVIVYVIMTWLISFEIINLRNRVVYRLAHFLEAMAVPILRPFRRFLPSFGGLDFSPFILVIVIVGLNRFIIPALFDWLRGLVSGGGSSL
jgi:YggT family protein